MSVTQFKEYRIRVIGEDGRAILENEWVYLTDGAAIASAKRMANGKDVEVWFGDELLFRRSVAFSKAVA